MLDVLRASKGGLITWIFLAAIIIVFVISFGPGSFAKGGGGFGAAPAYAARVNGKTIPAADWKRQYDQLIRYYQPQFGEGFTPELAVQLGLPRLALRSVVDRELVVQEAERRGIVVTPAEVARVIFASPSFQENGAYSKALYFETVNAQFGSPARYEELIHAELLQQRLLAELEATIKVSEAEVHQTWTAQADRVELAYVLFSAADARAEVKPSDAEVQAFATQQGPRIEKYYQDNAARFDQPRKARVRHVLAKVEGNDEAAAKKKIETALDRLKKGEDFAKVAAALSDDANTKNNGGDLGLISPGLTDDAFTQAALTLDKGQLSGPVRTPTGWHVLRVDEVVPARKVPLDQARPEIARDLLVKDRSEALLKEKAQAALQAAQGGKALADLFPAPAEAPKDGAEAKPAPDQEKKPALTLGGKPVVAQDSGPFLASAPFVPRLGPAADLLQDARAAKAGEVLPKVYQTPAGSVVAVVKDRQRPDEGTYAKEREQMELRIRAEKGQQVRTAWLAELRERATVVENDAILPRVQPSAQE